MTEPGRIVVLNGAPRSGKSSIARALQDHDGRPWVNLGVDVMRHAAPTRLQPGIGLRPGGERPDLEPFLPAMFTALYESVVAHCRLGFHVAVDVGHHDDHSRPLGILRGVARQLQHESAWFVGVRCPVEVIMQRRDAGDPDRVGTYLTSAADGTVPDPVLRWQHAVHVPGVYDLEVDTSLMNPAGCAAAVLRRLDEGPPLAFRRLARSPGPRELS